MPRLMRSARAGSKAQDDGGSGDEEGDEGNAARIGRIPVQAKAVKLSASAIAAASWCVEKAVSSFARRHACLSTWPLLVVSSIISVRSCTTAEARADQKRFVAATAPPTALATFCCCEDTDMGAPAL